MWAVGRRGAGRRICCIRKQGDTGGDLPMLIGVNGRRDSASVQCARALSTSPAVLADSASCAGCCSRSRWTSVEQAGQTSTDTASSVLHRVHARDAEAWRRSSNSRSDKARLLAADTERPGNRHHWRRRHSPGLVHSKRNDRRADETAGQGAHDNQDWKSE